VQDSFFFQLKTNVYYGLGRSREIGRILADKGLGNVVLLVDEGCAAASAYFAEVAGAIAAEAASVDTVLLRGSEEPDYDYLDAVAGDLRAKPLPDVIVAVGGGSCLDMAKAVAVLLTNPGQGVDYRGFDKVKVPGVPVMAVPTTAGTGSEVTINAVFTDKKEMRKLGINGLHMEATYGVLDGLWTMSCPISAAVSSGMDAMTHALESFICRKHNVLTRMYSKEAVRLLYLHLPALIDDPHNAEHRQLILLGSHLAAIALFNSGSGIAGGFSYPIGVHYKVPHGVAGAVFLGSVTRFNVERGYTDYAELLDLIEPAPGLSPREKSERFAERLEVLSEKLGVPRHLGQWGVTPGEAPKLESLLAGLQGAFDQNPVPFSATEDAPALLAKHLP
jgi:alcohol dehydrogenase class IV